MKPLESQEHLECQGCLANQGKLGRVAKKDLLVLLVSPGKEDYQVCQECLDHLDSRETKALKEFLDLR